MGVPWSRAWGTRQSANASRRRRCRRPQVGGARRAPFVPRADRGDALSTARTKLFINPRARAALPPELTSVPRRETTPTVVGGVGGISGEEALALTQLADSMPSFFFLPSHHLPSPTLSRPPHPILLLPHPPLSRALLCDLPLCL